MAGGDLHHRSGLARGDELDLEALAALEVGGVVLRPTGIRVLVGEHQGPPTFGARVDQRIDLGPQTTAERKVVEARPALVRSASRPFSWLRLI